MRFAVVEPKHTTMLRIAGPLLACALALANAPANAQAGATPTITRQWGKRSSVHAQRTYEASPPTTADDVCRAIEQSAAENALPVEFFARVVWQESRFNAGSSRLRSRPPTTSRMWATGGESFGSPRVPSVAALTSRTQERCIGR
jgi:hypothetical protein